MLLAALLSLALPLSGTDTSPSCDTFTVNPRFHGEYADPDGHTASYALEYTSASTCGLTTPTAGCPPVEASVTYQISGDPPWLRSVFSPPSHKLPAYAEPRRVQGSLYLDVYGGAPRASQLNLTVTAKCDSSTRSVPITLSVGPPYDAEVTASRPSSTATGYAWQLTFHGAGSDPTWTRVQVLPCLTFVPEPGWGEFPLNWTLPESFVVRNPAGPAHLPTEQTVTVEASPRDDRARYGVCLNYTGPSPDLTHHDFVRLAQVAVFTGTTPVPGLLPALAALAAGVILFARARVRP